MDSDLKLNEIEKAAKKFVLNLLLKGFQPTEFCDVDFSDDKFKLPEFYDDVKFKRGQKYFADNRFGILQSNLCGLYSLICEPNGASVLDRTDNSSTSNKAEKRYIDTITHMISWCTDKLKPGSKSWESLKFVRKMHLAASKASYRKKKVGIIQAWMTFTSFGFMGYALVKPHMMGIKYDCDEDREAFVHMWAVICSMLGVKDEFNMCLQSLEVTEMICHILIRYHFMPYLQLETKLFEKLGRAFTEGMKYYVPFSSYESQLFLTRRLAGIPGYQYKVDLAEEFHIRQIFTKEELEMLKTEFQSANNYPYRKNFVFDEKMTLIEIKRMPKNEKKELLHYDKNIYGVYKKLDDEERGDWHDYALLDLLELKDPSQLKIIRIDDAHLKNYINDSKFYSLSKTDQLYVNLAITEVKISRNYIARYLAESTLNVMISAMRKKSLFFSRKE